MSKGFVCGVCLAEKRGMPKKDQGCGYLKQGFGLVGDAHAGSEDRQVSILLEQQIIPVAKKLGQTPQPGSFAENLLVRSLPETGLAKGSILRIGAAMVEIVSIGKDDTENHTYAYEGFSLLAERGLFGRIIKSGRVQVGDTVEVIRK